MCKKIKTMVLAGLVLLMISGASFARGGNGGRYGHCGYRGGRRDYRPVYRHRIHRPVHYRCRYRHYSRPVYIYSSNGIFLSTSFIVIGIGF